jgi:fibronectin type 3 domain-containing protein
MWIFITLAIVAVGGIVAWLLLRKSSTSTPTQVPQITLQWAPESGVIGYNIYKAVNGIYTQLNTTLLPSPTYIDTNVTAGQSYTYAVTAVNANGQESTKSSPFTITA